MSFNLARLEMLTSHYANHLALKIRRQDRVNIVMQKGWEQIVAAGVLSCLVNEGLIYF